jgi:hypothetical protein
MYIYFAKRVNRAKGESNFWIEKISKLELPDYEDGTCPFQI